MADLKIYQQERTVKSRSHKKDYKDWLVGVFTELNEPLPIIKDGRGTRVARGWDKGMNLPKWARNEIVMLHEVAHVLQGRHGVGYKHDKLFKLIVLD